MSDLTNEQIQEILDGAPEGATHVDSLGFHRNNDAIRLSDLREIITLRQRVENLETVSSASMGVSGKIKDEAIKLGFNHASDDDPLSYLINMAKRANNLELTHAVAVAAIKDNERLKSNLDSKTEIANQLKDELTKAFDKQSEVAARAVEDAAKWIDDNYPNLSNPVCGLLTYRATQLREQSK